jgi:hypothetical protein
LLVAARVIPHFAVGVEAEPLAEGIALGTAAVFLAAHGRQQVEVLVGGHRGGQAQLARQVAHPLADGYPFFLAIEAKNSGRAPRRANHIEQNPQGGAFARAVGAEKTKYLAGLNAEIQCFNAPLSAVIQR